MTGKVLSNTGSGMRKAQGKYAWGDDGQDGEDREPEAFLVDAAAASRAEKWLESNFLLGTMEPLIDKEHRATAGNHARLTEKESAELASRMHAMEIENCEMAGRMSALEGLLREKEEQALSMSRQLQEYSQALGKRKALSRAFLAEQVAALTLEVQELRAENKALREAASAKPLLPTRSATAAQGEAGGGCCPHCGLLRRPETEERRPASKAHLSSGAVDADACGNPTTDIATDKGTPGRLGASDSLSARQRAQRQYRDEDDVDTPEHVMMHAQSTAHSERHVLVTQRVAADFDPDDASSTGSSLPEKPNRIVPSIQSHPAGLNAPKGHSGRWGHATVPGVVSHFYDAGGDTPQDAASPMALTCPATSIHAPDRFPQNSPPNCFRDSPEEHSFPRSFTAAPPQLLTSPTASCQPRGPMTSPGQLKPAADADVLPSMPLDTLPPAAMREYAPPKVFRISPPPDAAASAQHRLDRHRKSRDADAPKPPQLPQGPEHTVPGGPAQAAATGASLPTPFLAPATPPSLHAQQGAAAQPGRARGRLHAAVAASQGALLRTAKAAEGFQRMRERVIGHAAQGAGRTAPNRGAEELPGDGAEVQLEAPAAQPQLVLQSQLASSFDHHTAAPAPPATTSAISSAAAPSSQQGLGAVRGALITALRVKGGRREEVVRQLDGLLRTQRVTAEDIAAGLRERCLPLLTTVTPPPVRQSFSLFHRSKVTDAQQAFLSSPSVSLPAFLLSAAVALSWVPSDLFEDMLQMLPTLPVRRLFTLEFFSALFARMGKISIDMILSDLPNLDEFLGIEEENLPSVIEFSGCKEASDLHSRNAGPPWVTVSQREHAKSPSLLRIQTGLVA